MRIGEVSKITGLSEHTLRFYEKSGLLPMLAKRRGGVRDFCENDLRALGIIECLKKTGMTLAEIRQYMEWNAQGDKTIKQRYDMFIQRRDAVMQQMNDMQKTLEMVNYKIKYYATFGGTAFNILNMDYSMPFEENLISRFLENDSFFEKEAINVITSEIQKEENVNAILELIANGKTKFKELNDLLGDQSKDNISRYLAKLEEMDIIGKSYMVNDKFNKKPIYYIKNNLLDFYYSFVFKYQSTRQLMNSHLFYEKFVKEKFLKQYLPRKFEEIIKEYAIRKNSVDLPLFFNAGRLIYNAKQRKEYINREFDLVLETDKGFIPIECKFYSRPLNENDINEEINQWKGLPFNIYKYGFASLNGFDEKLREKKDLILIDSDDIYR